MAINKGNWVLIKDGSILAEGTFTEIWAEALNVAGDKTLKEFSESYKIRKLDQA